MRAAPSETEVMPMDLRFVLEVLNALANVARIVQAVLGIARVVRSMAREHKHDNG